MAEGPSPEVRRFLLEHIASVAQLEVLLLLRANPAEGWSAERLAGELRVALPWARDQLEDLRARGLLEREAGDPPTYRFRARTPELERTANALARDYILHRVTIIEIIYTKPSDSLRSFSDAFRLKRDREPPNG